MRLRQGIKKLRLGCMRVDNVMFDFISFGINENWLSNTVDILTIAVAISALVISYYSTKRNAYIPYITMLKLELDDIVLSLNHIFNNPQWAVENNEAWIENYKNGHEDFLKGNRFFILSGILLEETQIIIAIKSSSRRRMYFNMLRKRYIAIYEALAGACLKCSDDDKFLNYLEITEYKTIYDAYLKIKDL